MIARWFARRRAVSNGSGSGAKAFVSRVMQEWDDALHKNIKEYTQSETIRFVERAVDSFVDALHMDCYPVASLDGLFGVRMGDEVGALAFGSWKNLLLGGSVHKSEVEAAVFQGNLQVSFRNWIGSICEKERNQYMDELRERDLWSSIPFDNHLLEMLADTQIIYHKVCQTLDVIPKRPGILLQNDTQTVQGHKFLPRAEKAHKNIKEPVDSDHSQSAGCKDVTQPCGAQSSIEPRTQDDGDDAHLTHIGEAGKVIDISKTEKDRIDHEKIQREIADQNAAASALRLQRRNQHVHVALRKSHAFTHELTTLSQSCVPEGPGRKEQKKQQRQALAQRKERDADKLRTEAFLKETAVARHLTSDETIIVEHSQTKAKSISMIVRHHKRQLRVAIRSENKLVMEIAKSIWQGQLQHSRDCGASPSSR